METNRLWLIYLLLLIARSSTSYFGLKVNAGITYYPFKHLSAVIRLSSYGNFSVAWYVCMYYVHIIIHARRVAILQIINGRQPQTRVCRTRSTWDVCSWYAQTHTVITAVCVCVCKHIRYQQGNQSTPYTIHSFPAPITSALVCMYACVFVSL